MVSDEGYVFRRLNNLADILLTMAIFALSYQLRNNFATVKGWEDLGRLSPFGYYASLMILAAIVWPVLSNYHGLYGAGRLTRWWSNAVIILRSSSEALIFLIAIIYIFQIGTTSRLLLLVFGGMNSLAFIIKDSLVQVYLKTQRAKRRHVRRTLIVGSGRSAAEFISMTKDHAGLVGYHTLPIGIVLPDPMEGGVEGMPTLGTVEQFSQILHNNQVDQVVFTGDYHQHEGVGNALMLCAEEGIEAWVMINLFERYLAKARLDTIENLPVVIFRNAPVLTWQIIAKSIFDRLSALALLTLLLPLFGSIAACIYLSGRRPVLFRQERIGLHGRKFILCKFCSLEGNDPGFIGRWLRKTSLDELPQLINIIKGEMSFVGPRPHIAEEVGRYKSPWQRRRLSVKPGLTGLRQIAESKKISFDEQLELDLEYIDRWSLLGDMIILLRTIPSVVGRFFKRHSKEGY